MKLKKSHSVCPALVQWKRNKKQVTVILCVYVMKTFRDLKPLNTRLLALQLPV